MLGEVWGRCQVRGEVRESVGKGVRGVRKCERVWGGVR